MYASTTTPVGIAFEPTQIFTTAQQQDVVTSGGFCATYFNDKTSTLTPRSLWEAPFVCKTEAEKNASSGQYCCHDNNCYDYCVLTSELPAVQQPSSFHNATAFSFIGLQPPVNDMLILPKETVDQHIWIGMTGWDVTLRTSLDTWFPFTTGEFPVIKELGTTTTLAQPLFSNASFVVNDTVAFATTYTVHIHIDPILVTLWRGVTLTLKARSH